MTLVPAPVEFCGPGCTLEWNLPAFADMTFNPDGPLREILDAFGRVVTAGAKARAEVRTGRMRNAITYQRVTSSKGCYVQIVSPAVNPRDGFPYPLVHEDAHPRDRRPHRSLVPALRDAAKLTIPI